MGIDEVGLGDHEHVRKLDLVDEEIGDRTVVFVVSTNAHFVELLQHLEAIEEGRSVDDAHHGVEAGHR